MVSMFRIANRGLGSGLVLLAVLVAGCQQKKDRVAFEGIYFAAKTKKAGDDLAEFTSTIKGVSSSLDGALQAARYEGTKYCIANYGTSKINWRVGPETPQKQLVVVDDQITFSGRCDP